MPLRVPATNAQIRLSRQHSYKPRFEGIRGPSRVGPPTGASRGRAISTRPGVGQLQPVDPARVVAPDEIDHPHRVGHAPLRRVRRTRSSTAADPVCATAALRGSATRPDRTRPTSTGSCGTGASSSVRRDECRRAGAEVVDAQSGVEVDVVERLCEVARLALVGVAVQQHDRRVDRDSRRKSSSSIGLVRCRSQSRSPRPTWNCNGLPSRSASCSPNRSSTRSVSRTPPPSRQRGAAVGDLAVRRVRTGRRRSRRGRPGSTWLRRRFRLARAGSRRNASA